MTAASRHVTLPCFLYPHAHSPATFLIATWEGSGGGNAELLVVLGRFPDPSLAVFRHICP